MSNNQMTSQSEVTEGLRTRAFIIQITRPLTLLLLAMILGAFVFGGCESSITVVTPGCEDCPERCLRDKEGKAGKCVTCLEDKQCQTKDSSPTKKCLENKCVCGTDKDCGVGQVCGSADKGQAGCVECTKDEQCKEEGRSICQSNECVACRAGGEEKCAPDGVKACKQGIRKCKVSGIWDTCEGWVECKDGQKCFEGACVADCPDPPPCKEKLTTCTSKVDELPGKYTECKKNAKGCFELSEAKTCGAKEFCDKGSCMPFDCPKAECRLDETKCSNESRFRTCVKNANGCLIWDDGKDCKKDTKCRLSANRCVVCNPGDKQSCYDGVAGTKNNGICRGGEQKCADDGSKWGDCKEQIIPQPETCDGKDNDCNGKIDDKLTPRPCGNQTGSCKGSVQRCDGAKGWTKCDANDYKKVFAEYEDKETKCDGKDNDCDGTLDNLANAPECTKKSGVCKGAKQKCDGSKGWIDCDAKAYKAHNPIYEPVEKLCDGKDNDCNGQVDESFANLGRTCSAGKGICKKNGIFSCKSDGSGLQCSAIAGTALKEICNGKDDDCDGLTDESLTKQCYSGSAGCTRSSTGKYTCTGACKAGTQSCINGRFSSCTGQVKNRTEFCNGKDDDCDGRTDEGNPGGGANCTVTTKLGNCRAGQMRCSSGSVKCIQVVSPKAEVCNGKDDDCDGSVDDNAPCAKGKECKGGACSTCSQPGDHKCREVFSVCVSSASCPACRCGLSCYCKRTSSLGYCYIKSCH